MACKETPAAPRHVFVTWVLGRQLKPPCVERPHTTQAPPSGSQPARLSILVVPHTSKPGMDTHKPVMQLIDFLAALDESLATVQVADCMLGA